MIQIYYFNKPKSRIPSLQFPAAGLNPWNKKVGRGLGGTDLQGKKAELCIRISMDPHHFGNLDLHPDPHQIEVRIRIKVINWIRNRSRNLINFQMTSQNVCNMSLFEPLLRSWYLDPHQGDKSDPDPHQIKIRIRIRIRVFSRIRICTRIRINVMWIYNTFSEKRSSLYLAKANQ